MSNERFDKFLKKNLESVRPAYNAGAWTRFQKRLPVSPLAAWLLNYGGWVVSSVLLSGWLVTGGSLAAGLISGVCGCCVAAITAVLSVVSGKAGAAVAGCGAAIESAETERSVTASLAVSCLSGKPCFSGCVFCRMPAAGFCAFRVVAAAGTFCVISSPSGVPVTGAARCVSAESMPRTDGTGAGSADT